MKIVNNYLEVLSVNVFSALSLIIAFLAQMTGILTVLVLVSSLVYNCLKIYKFLKNRKGK